MKAPAKNFPAAPLETTEIPTLVFGARTHLPCAVALVITLPDDPRKCRGWLHRIEHEITYGHERTDHAAVVAFTATGLTKLGLPEADLAMFPVAFQSGMTGPGRSRVLGDLDANAPAKWHWGYKNTSCDAILVLYDETKSSLHARETTNFKWLTQTGCERPLKIDLQNRQHVQTPPGSDESREPEPAAGKPHRDYPAEPFGFADGISQPIIRGTPRAKDKQQEILPAGAFILGYEGYDSEYGAISPLIPHDHDPAKILPSITGADGVARADLGRNGSYLVVRQLEQDVAGFWNYIAKHQTLAPATLEDPQKKDWFAAKLVGRWPNGASLVRHPAAPGENTDNDFLYHHQDPLGLACPLGAHIRRANPRDSLTSDPKISQAITSRHRLLRVGRPYNDAKNKPAGILFMCLNADIEVQFETVQQSWLNRTDFHGLRNESDPLAGGAPVTPIYTIPTSLGPTRLKDVPDFVTVIGGGYFFLPSRAAIRYLATLDTPK